MRTVLLCFAAWGFMVLVSCCVTARAQTSYDCLGQTTENCPPEPAKCGDQPCDPNITWEVNSDNPCELIPVFTPSCPNNTKEPVSYRATPFSVCQPRSQSTGFDAFDSSTVVCWKWRYCSAACTKTTEPAGVINTKPNPNAPQSAGCASLFTPRQISYNVYKCNAGVSSGDISLGQEQRDDETCTGERMPCFITE